MKKYILISSLIAHIFMIYGNTEIAIMSQYINSENNNMQKFLLFIDDSIQELTLKLESFEDEIDQLLDSEPGNMPLQEQLKRENYLNQQIETYSHALFDLNHQAEQIKILNKDIKKCYNEYITREEQYFAFLYDLSNQIARRPELLTNELLKKSPRGLLKFSPEDILRAYGLSKYPLFERTKKCAKDLMKITTKSDLLSHQNDNLQYTIENITQALLNKKFN